MAASSPTKLKQDEEEHSDEYDSEAGSEDDEGSIPDHDDAAEDKEGLGTSYLVEGEIDEEDDDADEDEDFAPEGSDEEDEYVPVTSVEKVPQRRSTRKRPREATDEGAPSEGLRSAKKRASDATED